ncbi:receptor-type tyrosine-protein phosphatase epsilon-like [Gigantopelta aegis]|uniref:receptor-type tyrosine-protein phosphatase epsilon-like n=1 Tax=Gigantopelta aegis TaxID=1735272 RepID=UPI001B88B5E9|nr:receptor-type tyrosine-protein phosphatase epsilon-like [Gigantopelta aegis]
MASKCVRKLYDTPRCSPGRYQCHCAEGCKGNIEEFECGSCENGYYGRFCQNENVALNKTAHQSTSCPGYEGEAWLAVDGDNRTDFIDQAPFHCTCSQDDPRFWEVDLDQWRLFGFYIEADGHECYRWPNMSHPPTIFEVNCIQQGRRLTFRLPSNNTDVLTLCEIQVFDVELKCNVTLRVPRFEHPYDSPSVVFTEAWYDESCGLLKAAQMCTDFWYGADCVKTCNCRDQTEVCDKKTGKCTACLDGWNGTACDIASSDDGNVVGAAVGATVPVVFIVTATALAVFFWRRRKNAGSRDKDDYAPEEALAPKPKEGKIPTNARLGETIVNTNSEVEVDDDHDEFSHPRQSTLVTDNVYVNYTDSEIPMERLHSYIQYKTEENFKEEFDLLPYGLQVPHEVGKYPINRKKNRYRTTFPYDHSRVKLKVTEAVKSDYINANYIDGYKKENAYIATQGPVPLTTDDFWRMIWEQGVNKMVMLSNLVEDGKTKCEQYWPELNSVKTTGELKVKNVNVFERSDYTIRQFLIDTDQSKRTHIVKMFHFTTWPDHGVPSAPALLGFWKQVKKETESSGPVLVHCSAGIGRTGTFIGLDYLVDEAKDTKVVNIFQCVRKMRDNRVNMVQTLEQYQFLHEVLLEAISSMDTFYTVDSLNDVFFSGKAKPSDEKRRLQQEFNNLQRLKTPVSQTDIDTAMTPENKLKNRRLSVVPVSYNRLYLCTPVLGTNDYINAVTFPSSSYKTGFVVTQLPLEHTVIDFWRMVYEQNSHTIVSLTGDERAQVEKDTKFWPGSGESVTIGPITIDNQSTVKSSGGIMETSLTLTKETSYENEDKKTLQLFTLNNWSADGGLPSDKYELLLFLDKLQRRRDDIDNSPIIVQCIDGAKYSGLFCVLSNIIEKLKLDKDVDVFVTLRELQCIRPQIVETFEQYKYCYEVVKEYLRSLEIYTNL